MTADRFLRRGDDRLVAAIAFTGDNADAVRAWLSGYRITKEGRVLVDTGHHEDATLEVRPGNWLVRDDEGVRAVPADEFLSRYRAQPVEREATGISRRSGAAPDHARVFAFLDGVAAAAGTHGVVRELQGARTITSLPRRAKTLAQHTGEYETLSQGQRCRGGGRD